MEFNFFYIISSQHIQDELRALIESEYKKIDEANEKSTDETAEEDKLSKSETIQTKINENNDDKRKLQTS